MKRTCWKCKVEKPLTSEYFYKCLNGKYGLDYRCKECSSEKTKEWIAKNHDRQQKSRRRFNEKRTQKDRSEYHQKIRLAVLCAYSSDPPKCAKCGETENKFLALDHLHGGGGKHRREVNHNLVDYLKAQGFPVGYQVLCHNCNFLKQYRKPYTGKWPSQNAWQRKTRKEAIAKYSHGKMACMCCGFSQEEALTIDHIDGVPEDHRGKQHRGGVGLYLWLRQNNWPEGFQTLCANCNFAKGHYGCCPHTEMEAK